MEKVFLPAISFLFLIHLGCTTAGDTNSTTASLTNCGANVNLSCSLVSSNSPHKLGEPLVLKVSIENLSSNAIHFFESDAQRDVTFVVTDSLGHKLMPKFFPANRGEELGRDIVSLKPTRKYGSVVRLSELYDFKDPGQYSVATHKFLLVNQGPCEAVSAFFNFVMKK